MLGRTNNSAALCLLGPAVNVSRWTASGSEGELLTWRLEVHDAILRGAEGCPMLVRPGHCDLVQLLESLAVSFKAVRYDDDIVVVGVSEGVLLDVTVEVVTQNSCFVKSLQKPSSEEGEKNGRQRASLRYADVDPEQARPVARHLQPGRPSCQIT